MAFRFQGSSNSDLIDYLKRRSVIKSPLVEAAMNAVDRGKFAKMNPYMDGPQSIGCNVTISAPHMHAHALSLLENNLKEGSTVLDIGSGSGYLTACMAIMVGQTGRVVGIEHIEELARNSVETIRTNHPDLIEMGRLVIYVGDGRLGSEFEAPFDAIHVGAASPTLPKELTDQLKPGGRMVIPIGPKGGPQFLEQIDKLQDGTYKRTQLLSVKYGMLTDKDLQWPGN